MRGGGLAMVACKMPIFSVSSWTRRVVHFIQVIPTMNLVKGKFGRLVNESKRNDTVDIVVLVIGGVLLVEEEFQNASVDIDGKIQRRQ